MVEDAKAARDRRLAEALRANLKRRKAAKTTRNKVTGGKAEAATPADRPRPAERDD